MFALQLTRHHSAFQLGCAKKYNFCCKGTTFSKCSLLRVRYALVTNVGPLITHCVVISSKTDPQLLWSTIRKLALLNLLKHHIQILLRHPTV